MRRAREVKLSGTWTVPITGSVTLPFEDRHRRRIRMTDDDGEPFMLDLANAAQLSDGDGLVLEKGGVIVVRAAQERVVELYCASTVEAMRLAWHIGNRHTPMQVLAGGILRIAADHVLVEMAEGLGATAEQRIAPFQPEGGAYTLVQGHGHDH